MPALIKIFLLMSLFTAKTAYAQDVYGLIYVSKSQPHLYWGVSRGWEDFTDAHKSAFYACRGDSPPYANDCKEVLWFKNACAALAIGSDGYGAAWGETRKKSNADAIRNCQKHTKKCKVVESTCE
jgi:hypothetical protein